MDVIIHRLPTKEARARRTNFELVRLKVLSRLNEDRQRKTVVNLNKSKIGAMN